ncbi:MAG: Fic family protein [Acetobacteraceae bacterium]|nr:Fic family protein [Acetobacteraceae bacterium]
MGRVDHEEAGRYSQHQRAILGSPLLLPSPAELPALVGEFAKWLSEALEPVTAFAAMSACSRSIPFADGNGRTARLLMNLILLKAGYPPVVIGPEQGPAYIDALQAMQLSGNIEPYNRLMAGRLETSLDHHIAFSAGEWNGDKCIACAPKQLESSRGPLKALL